MEEIPRCFWSFWLLLLWSNNIYANADCFLTPIITLVHLNNHAGDSFQNFDIISWISNVGRCPPLRRPWPISQYFESSTVYFHWTISQRRRISNWGPGRNEAILIETRMARGDRQTRSWLHMTTAAPIIRVARKNTRPIWLECAPKTISADGKIWMKMTKIAE